MGFIKFNLNLKSKQVTQSYIQDDVLIKDRFTVGRAR